MPCSLPSSSPDPRVSATAANAAATATATAAASPASDLALASKTHRLTRRHLIGLATAAPTALALAACAQRSASPVAASGVASGVASAAAVPIAPNGPAAAPNAASAAASTPAPAAEAADPALPGGLVRRIAFGSCIDQNKPAPLLDAIAAWQPDLMIYGGDNVYASPVPWSEAKLREAYATLAGKPEFARLRAAVPSLAIWDDHDYGVNDGGADFAHKDAAKAAFMDFWRLPANDPRRQRAGLYHAVVLGPVGRRVQVILLDGRSFRSELKQTDQRNVPGKERYLPDDDRDKTLLGEAQWQWLEAQLRQPAELRLLVSGVQVIAEGHGWESWGNLPRERERLSRLVESTGARGVVLLSGDRHLGAIYRQPRVNGYPFYELTSSGITHAFAQAREAGPNRLTDLVTVQNFGSVEVDWAQAWLVLRLHDYTGKTVRRQLVQLAELR